MKFDYINDHEPPQHVVWNTSLGPTAPTQAERETMRRLAESYSEDDYRHMIEAARPRHD